MTREIRLSRLTLQWPLYLFLLPSFLLVALFSYYPAISAIVHSFYEWNMDTVRNFYGLTHFNRLLGKPGLFIGAAVVMFAVLITGRSVSRVARASRLVAGIIIPLESLIYLALKPELLDGSFSVSMVAGSFAIWGIPSWLSATRMDPLNPSRPIIALLLASAGLLQLLLGIGMSSQAAWQTVTILVMAACLTIPSLACHRQARLLQTFSALSGMGVVLWVLAAHAGGDTILWHGFGVILILVVANIFKMIPSIITAVVIHRLKSQRANYWYKVLFVIPMIIPFTVSLLIWKFFFQPDGIFNMVLEHSGMSQALAWMDALFGWGGAVFSTDQPALWLGSPELVIPALIIWGFPWVSTIGVLIFLAGLQSIDQAIYEAGDVDGISAIGKFLYIELPLILTQVRINLVLMIISTLQSYGAILMLFGDSGGPNGKLMIPGLYMFRSAFVTGAAGKACAIGLILFVLILMLTELNNRYIKVSK
jgi:raffinose/stachyose/melibiose transport system permease protein